MKNFKNSCFLFVFMLAFIIVSCNKSEEASPSNTDTEINETKRNEATWILGDDNSKGFWMIFKILVGHTAEQCGNSCMMLFGQNYHADCRGFGSVCNRSFHVAVSEDIYSKLCLFIMDEDELEEYDQFFLPDRSLYITNPLNSSEQWLNIPEQILFQDSALMQVIIHNIWFSEEAEFDNE